MSDLRTDGTSKQPPSEVVPAASGTDQPSLAAPSPEALAGLRLLDLDDLFLLRHFRSGLTVAATARHLGLTQPAVTQRVRKIERVFGANLVERTGRTIRLTAIGQDVCRRADEALNLMLSLTPGPERQELVIGVRSDLLEHWVWRVIADLRRAKPELTLQVHAGSNDELLRELDQGSVDAAIVSSPARLELAGPEWQVETIADLTSAFVAAPALAGQVNDDVDLQNLTLIEGDRTAPVLRILAATERARLRFGAVWHVGDPRQVLNAALAGHGVALLPLQLTQAHIAAGRLKTVLEHIPVPGETIRMVVRSGQSDSMTALLEALRATQLR